MLTSISKLLAVTLTAVISVSTMSYIVQRIVNYVSTNQDWSLVLTFDSSVWILSLVGIMSIWFNELKSVDDNYDFGIYKTMYVKLTAKIVVIVYVLLMAWIVTGIF